MSDSYTRTWKALCMRCNRSLSHKDYTCNNCGKGNVLANVVRYANDEKSISLGCNVCDEPYGYYLKCPCGANINSSRIHDDNPVKMFFKGDSDDCFIATAVFGNATHIVVNELRYMRDNGLMRFDAGRNFIDWYYKNGPKLAKYIKNKPTLKAAAQVMLTPLGGAVRLGRQIFSFRNVPKHNPT